MVHGTSKLGVEAGPWLNRADARPGWQAGGDVTVTVPVATILTVAGATAQVQYWLSGVLVAGATVCAWESTAQV